MNELGWGGRGRDVLSGCSPLHEHAHIGHTFLPLRLVYPPVALFLRYEFYDDNTTSTNPKGFALHPARLASVTD